MKYEVEYLGGHPDLTNPGKIYLTVVKEHKNILLEERGFLTTNKKMLIDTEEIVAIDLDEKSDRSAGKAVAGAVIGGVLTGGVGLLLGGALGGKKKNHSNIYITIDYDGINFQVMLKTGKWTNMIYAEICGLFS
ncbi:hypothetical protein [Labilibaculum sp.]|uniref:hypothetical protein n=1 Tax=Labilibaculum sp. TaxID=2060723 RepID=UPI0035698D72